MFLADSYDISDLAGAANGALRFSYATDPGLARPGWFIDDVKVTADRARRGAARGAGHRLRDQRRPDDERVYNGGCRRT